MTRTPERPSEHLTFARFEALAEAYGGDVSRWPADTREAAALTIAEAPGVAGRILAAASDLDAALDSWRVAAASRDLRDAILAEAPRARRRFKFGAWFARAGLGAGLAAACAAGVVVGAQVSALSLPPAGTEAVASALKGYDALALDGTAAEIAG